MQPPDILRQRPPPRDGQRQEERIKNRLIEAFTQVSPCRQNDARAPAARFASRLGLTPFRGAKSAPQDNQITLDLGERATKRVDVIASLR